MLTIISRRIKIVNQSADLCSICNVAPNMRVGLDNFRAVLYNRNIFNYIFKEKTIMEETEFRYDTQLFIEGKNLSEDAIRDYFTKNFKGDCLIAVGDSELIKIHFHTNEPWDVLSYCASLGEIFDIVVEDMDRQSRGLQG